MKFFFQEFGSCFGGAVITPPTETVSVADHVSTTRRRSSSTKNWRPELSVIAEDGGGVMNVSRQRHESVRSEKKPLSKSKSTGKTRSYSYGGDYRSFTHSMAIPAFSPTPFVF